MARKKTEISNKSFTGKKTPAQSETQLQWPKITTKEALECRELIPDQIYVIDEFLSVEECASFSKFITSLPLVATPPPKKGEATRVNHRISFQSKEFAMTVFNAIWPHLPTLPCSEIKAADAIPAGCNSNIRLYKYGPGEYFGPHYDDSVRDKETGWWSEWTVLVYVTGKEDGVDGGETVFFGPTSGSRSNTEAIVPPLTRGSALIHRHGRACMLHEGRQVKAGTKLVLRTDIMFARLPH
ncbi:ALG3 protein, partial [Rhizoctonia solani]